MTYPLNPSVCAVQAPPIAETQSWVEGRAFPAEKPLLDVAQAVPDYPPALPLREHLARLIRENGAAQYTDILGLPALREAFATHMSAEYAGGVTPGQVGITAGGNQAFCLTMGALARPGDEVLLPVPYYFNHHMWLEMSGIRPVLLPFDERNGGIPDADAAAALITERTRAIALVTPNNPTGAVYDATVMDRFFTLAQARNLALVVDETYKDFRPDDHPPHDLFQRPDWPRTLVYLYSFSKAYSLPGYRVGAIAGAPRLLEEVAKIADCVAICAPRVGQEAALFGLTHLAEWRAENRRKMLGRVTALVDAFREAESGYRLVSVGAYFAYIRHPFAGESAVAVARRLADDQNVLSLPGSMFGPEQEPYLRFAFANLEANRMPALVGRLAASTRG